MVQQVKNLPAMQETQEMGVWSLVWEDSPGEGNGYPLQYFCLENPMDRGAWWVHEAPESDTTEWPSAQQSTDHFSGQELGNIFSVCLVCKSLNNFLIMGLFLTVTPFYSSIFTWFAFFYRFWWLSEWSIWLCKEFVFLAADWGRDCFVLLCCSDISR